MVELDYNREHVIALANQGLKALELSSKNDLNSYLKTIFETQIAIYSGPFEQEQKIKKLLEEQK